MNEKHERIPTLEYLAEDYAMKVKTISIGSLQAYLRCGYVRAAKIIDMMNAAGLVEKIDDCKYKWLDGE